MGFNKGERARGKYINLEMRLMREKSERESKRVRGGEVRTKWHLVFKIRHIKKQRARLKKHTLRRLWFHPED